MVNLHGPIIQPEEPSAELKKGMGADSTTSKMELHTSPFSVRRQQEGKGNNVAVGNRGREGLD